MDDEPGKDSETLINAAIGWAVVLIISAALILWLGTCYDLSEIKDAAARANLWQAWAVICAGVLAVSGAVHVGRKQVAIQLKQVEIAQRQINSERDLREKEIKLALLDRRISAIDTMSAFNRKHAHTYTNLEEQERHLIYDALNQARLIFPENLAAQFKICIEKVTWRKATLQVATQLQTEHAFDQSIDYESKATNLSQEIMGLFDNLLESMIAHARVDL